MTSTGHRFPKGIAPDDWQVWASDTTRPGRHLHLGALGRLSCMSFPQVFQTCCIQSNEVVLERCEPPEELEEGALGAILVDLPLLLEHPEIADALPFGFACAVVVPEGRTEELVTEARKLLFGKATWVGLLGDPLGFVIDDRPEFGGASMLAKFLNLCFDEPALFDVFGDIAHGGLVNGWTERNMADHLFSGWWVRSLASRFRECTLCTPPLTRVWMRVGLASTKLGFEIEARRQLAMPGGEPMPVELELEVVDIGGARHDWDTEVTVFQVWGGSNSLK